MTEFTSQTGAIVNGSIELVPPPVEQQETNGHSKTAHTPSVLDIELLNYSADDAGNAKAMYRLYKDKTLYSPAYGWMRWTGTHWQRVSNAIAIRLAMRTLIKRRLIAVEAGKHEDVVKASKPDSKNINGCIQIFKAHVTIENVNEFDSDPDLLNCRNGVVNLRTGSITPHLPCQRFTYCVPVEYKPDADMSEWSTFIHEVLLIDDVVHYIQKCIGYSFTGHTREEKLFYLFGPPRAGKGTFTETLLALLPRPIGTEVDFNSFTARRDADSQNFDLAPLKPARFVVASESNRYQSLNPAKIKQVTGGNLIRCAFKHQDMFEYRPQYCVWLVSNHEVNADVDDDALWGRVQVVTFPLSHLGKEDTTLKERLRQTANLEGVLRWVIDGSMMWYADGLKTPPDAVAKATSSQRDKLDYVKQWADECCDFVESEWTPSARLMKSYKSWCEANNIKAVPSSMVTDTLTKRFGCKSERSSGRANRVRGFSGVIIISSIHDGYDNVDGGHGGQQNQPKKAYTRNIENMSDLDVHGVHRPPSKDEINTSIEDNYEQYGLQILKTHKIERSVPVCPKCSTIGRVIPESDHWTCLDCLVSFVYESES